MRETQIGAINETEMGEGIRVVLPEKKNFFNTLNRKKKMKKSITHKRGGLNRKPNQRLQTVQGYRVICGTKKINTTNYRN